MNPRVGIFCSYGLAGLALVLLIAGTTVNLWVPGVVLSQVGQRTRPSRDQAGSDFFKVWVSPTDNSKDTVPITVKFWMFNCKNPAEFEAGTAKAEFELHGPYVHSQHRVKNSVGWPSSGLDGTTETTVSYTYSDWYEYDKAATEAAMGKDPPLTTALTMPNLFTSGVDSFAWIWNFYQKDAKNWNATVSALKLWIGIALKTPYCKYEPSSEKCGAGSCTVTCTTFNKNASFGSFSTYKGIGSIKSGLAILFGAVCQACLDVAPSLAVQMYGAVGKILPVSFAMVPNNNTLFRQGPTSQDLGLGNLDDQGKLRTWAGFDELPWWNSTRANALGVTDGTRLHPGIRDDENEVEVFIDLLFRKAPLKYKDDTVVKGVKGRRYKLDFDKLFQVDPDYFNAIPGFMNATSPIAYTQPAPVPIMASRPFQHGVASEYRDKVVWPSKLPEELDGESVFVYEPVSGAGIKVRQAFQLNCIHFGKDQLFPGNVAENNWALQNRTNSIIAPLFIAQVETEVTPGLAAQLRTLQSLNKHAPLYAGVPLLVVATILALSAFFTYRAHKKKSTYTDEPSKFDQFGVSVNDDPNLDGGDSPFPPTFGERTSLIANPSHN